MKFEKKKTLTVVGIILLIVTFISLSYAFFQAQGGASVTRNVTVTTHTLDTLSFSISDNIAIEATQQNFALHYGNLSDEAIASALLTPNSKTGSASKNYYMYLVIPGNEISYCSTNTNHDPELLLQVYNDSNQLVTLTGLGSQKTIKGVTGYDITGVSGIIPLLDNHQISASSNTETTENWRVVITLINLDINQNENTGKSLTASLMVQEEGIINPSNITLSGVSSYTTCTDLYCALNELYGTLYESYEAF